MRFKKKIIMILVMLGAFLSLEFMFIYQSAFPGIAAHDSLSPSILNHYISTIVKKPGLDRDNLLDEQSLTIYNKCATPIIRLALSHADWISPENQFILHRPDDLRYMRYYYGELQTTLTYDTPEGNFKIHYTESGNNAVFESDGNQTTIPDYVISLGSFFEYAWHYEINMLGYIPPPPDGTNGGDSKFDVYVLDINYYGYTEVENGHPFIVIHNNYNGFESNLDPADSRTGNMKVTAAHEFFHAIQYFYDDWNDNSIWWEENTAVWMEDEVFNEVDAYLNYLGTRFDDLNGNLRWDSGEPWYNSDDSLGGYYGREIDVWFEAPHISLDTASITVFPRYEYGGVIWAKYIAAIFGHDFIKQSLIKSGYDTDALTALIETFQDHGTDLKDVFSNFRINVLTLNQNIFEEAEKYPLIRHYANYENYPNSFNIGDVSHLSCRYIGLKPPLGENRLIIQADGQDNSDFAVALVLFKNTEYVTRYISINDIYHQTGQIEISSFGIDGVYNRAVLIPINLSTKQDYRSISFSVSTQKLFSLYLSLKKGINLVSFPPNLVQNSSSYDFLTTLASQNERGQFACFDQTAGKWLAAYLMNGQPAGDNFTIDWLKGYIISLPNDMSIRVTGEPPYISLIELFPGPNIIPALIADKESIQSHDLFNSAQVNKETYSSILGYDTTCGKWQTVYRFFNKPAGEDFKIYKEGGYIIDLPE